MSLARSDIFWLYTSLLYTAHTCLNQTQMQEEGEELLVKGCLPAESSEQSVSFVQG